MSQAQALLDAMERIRFACRRRGVRAPQGAASRVTPQQMEVLRSLHPTEPVMVGELADHLGVTPSTVSLMLKRMESRGLVARRRDPADRRAMNVYLTPRGAELREGWAELDLERVDRLLLSLDPARRAQAVRGLRILAEAADRLVRRGGAHLEALTGDHPPDGPDGLTP